MRQSVKLVLVVTVLLVVFTSAIAAFEPPPRKLEIKPYVSLFMASSLWELSDGTNRVEDATTVGFGAAMRTQVSGPWGIVLNANYQSFDAQEGLSSDGVLFTLGGYHEISAPFGEFAFDLSYGVIMAADQTVGLLMPGLEYSRPISSQTSLAIQVSLPIPNDWPKSFEFEENFGSFSFTIGTSFAF